jgi:RHS repeat-associated protein
VHADHLNTPRSITTAETQNKEVWRWDNDDPFGDNQANDDPDGDGTKIEFNLRFPGQYFDKESKTHYNMMRDYNPATGRYIQSDPIGLEGGLNRYTYVENAPASRSDPLGLLPKCTSRILGVDTKEWTDTTRRILDRRRGVGVREVRPGVGAELPSRTPRPLLKPELKLSLWLYEWRKLLVSTYFNQEVFQRLRYMCDETRTDSCGRTEQFHTEFDSKEKVSGWRKFLRDNVIEERQWIRHLYDLSI